jgi:hypothetical protein
MRKLHILFLLGLCLLSCVRKQEEASMLDRWAGKPVLASRLVDDMEGRGRWAVREGNPRIEYTRERFIDGEQALRQTVSLVDSTHILDPANRTPWDSFSAEQGGLTCVALEFDEPQDWSAWNRISLWVYIHPSRNPNVSFALDLVNGTQPDGTLTPSRETNLDIPQGQWTQVLWEIDYFPRDSILRFELCQTCTGFDRGIGEQTVTIDFDCLELQRVKPDHYEGWDIPAGEIVFSHVGYRPGDGKVALAAAGRARKFTIRDERGRAVYKGDVQWTEQKENRFACLDFSGFRKPGTYRIRYGNTESQPFTIGEHVWQRPLEAAVNFYYHQRCGYPVEGIHGVCHEDVLGFHGDERKPVNGGWHDAGDLSQGTWRTAYASYALLEAGEREEAAWGVVWLLKTRFADGYHMSWSTIRMYTDGEVGTFDDVVTPAQYVPWELFLTSAVFSKAGEEQAAVEDWEAAMRSSQWEDADYLVASWGAVSSALLYERYKEDRYRSAALHFGDLLIRCQEQECVDGIPYAGYFYTDSRRRAILHDHHAAYNEAPMLAFKELSRVLPEESAPWKHAARLFVDQYLKPGSGLSAPYHLLPAGIFRRAEMRTPADIAQYEAGTPVNADYAIRTFPIWKDHIFHGATNFHLSQAWALAAAAALLEDREAMALVQEQLEWTLGRNPFGSSLMYGVGYNYAPDFAYCTRNIVGALPVGVDCFHDDAPFWNGTAHATAHEIWVEPVSRFVGTLAAFLEFETE